MSDNNFKPRAISEFLTAQEGYQFDIPSFQRGYRWTSKQVKDLLKDLYDFSNKDSEDSMVYYLQPLVVRGEGYRWQILDGQQRLTTLKLILNALKDYCKPAILKLIKEYDIHYLNRPKLNFNAPCLNDNLDSYYVSKAIETIEDWKTEHSSDYANLSEFADVLFGVNKKKAIKFIWYEVDDSSDSGSIATFNRLNRGKLKLTPSELIKALLIISADETDTTILSMEWSEIEKQFMYDDFSHL